MKQQREAPAPNEKQINAGLGPPHTKKLNYIFIF